MFIQTEITPNPATLKFLPGKSVMAVGTADFRSMDSAKNSPLAQRLFGLQGVEGVFLGRDFVSVTKAADTDWAMLKSMVMAALLQHFSTGEPIFIQDQEKQETSSALDNEIVKQIKELIETRVRPAVMQDGGDIVFDRFEEGIVYLEMQGACAGCPSSTMTLKSGIENMLKHYVPEVLEVRQSSGY